MLNIKKLFWSRCGLSKDKQQQRTSNSKSKDEIQGFFASLRMTTFFDDSIMSKKML